MYRREWDRIHYCLTRNRRVLHGVHDLFHETVNIVDRRNRNSVPSNDFSDVSLLQCVNCTDTHFILKKNLLQDVPYKMYQTF